MKYLRLFESKSESEIEEIFRKHGWRGSFTLQVGSDGSVNTHGNVDMSRRNLRKIPHQFGKVGNFWFEENKLKTLENSPVEVSGIFSVSHNRLKDLKGGPKRVGGDYLCAFNRLTTLEGVSSSIEEDFFCNNNRLTDLEHFPKVGRSVYISDNPVSSVVQYFIDRGDRDKVIELFNFSRVIQGGMRVILNRLEYVFDAYDIEITDEMLKGIEKYYTIVK